MAPDVASILVRNLREALGRGDIEQAELVLERLRDAEPLSARTRGMELQFLVRCDRLGEAWQLAQQLVPQFPDSAGILFWAGRAAYRRRDYRNAQRLFRESRRIADRWTTRRWLGKALTQLGGYEEAERLLAPLVAEHPTCGTDLAWLHERMGELDRALEVVEQYLQHMPDNEFARQQRTRLMARTADADEVVGEVDTLRDLGEAVPTEMLPSYVETLLARGEAARVRELLAETGPLDLGLTTRLAWVTYKASELDLAFDLFVQAMPRNLRDNKFHNSLGRAARLCDRQQELLAAYERHAEQEPRLYGRIRKLEAILGRT